MLARTVTGSPCVICLAVIAGSLLATQSAWSANTVAPAPATQADSLQQKLNAAKADAAKASDDYKRATAAALANDPAYKAAAAKTDDVKKQLDDARASGSSDLPRLAQQYLDALAQLSTIKAKSTAGDPAVTAAKQKADAAAAVVIAIQSEIDRQAGERPSGFSDAQWAMALAAFNYRSQCASDLAAAQKVLDSIPSGPDRNNGGNWGAIAAARQKQTVDLLRANLNSIRRGEVVIPDAPTIKDSGHIPATQFVIRQIISATEMIAAPDSPPAPFYFVPGAFSNPDPSDPAYHTDTVGSDVWISGYPTKGLADGQLTTIEGDFFASTKTYTTALGSQRTIPMLERVDTSVLKPAVDYLIYQSTHSPPAGRK